jgi:hypothetical protein
MHGATPGIHTLRNSYESVETGNLGSTQSIRLGMFRMSRPVLKLKVLRRAARRTLTGPRTALIKGGRRREYRPG